MHGFPRNWQKAKAAVVISLNSSYRPAVFKLSKSLTTTTSESQDPKSQKQSAIELEA